MRENKPSTRIELVTLSAQIMEHSSILLNAAAADNDAAQNYEKHDTGSNRTADDYRPVLRFFPCGIHSIIDIVYHSICGSSITLRLLHQGITTC
jgi:hypothetical protein